MRQPSDRGGHSSFQKKLTSHSAAKKSPLRKKKTHGQFPPSVKYRVISSVQSLCKALRLWLQANGVHLCYKTPLPSCRPGMKHGRTRRYGVMKRNSSHRPLPLMTSNVTFSELIHSHETIELMTENRRSIRLQPTQHTVWIDQCLTMLHSQGLSYWPSTVYRG